MTKGLNHISTKQQFVFKKCFGFGPQKDCQQSSKSACEISRPWVRVTLADLYIGFILSAIVIGCFERRWILRIVWIAPVFVLGNVWTAIWFAWRAPELFRRLAAS